MISVLEFLGQDDNGLGGKQPRAKLFENEAVFLLPVWTTGNRIVAMIRRDPILLLGSFVMSTDLTPLTQFCTEGTAGDWMQKENLMMCSALRRKGKYHITAEQARIASAFIGCQ